MNRGNIPDLTFLGTQLAIFQKSQQPNIWELMNSCFIDIKFCSFKNPFTTIITSLSELYFRFTGFEI